jgi:hypothetical protein
VKGHINQQRQIIRSTQLPPDVKDPTVEIKQEGKCHAVYVDVAEADQIYMDITSVFWQQSSSGNTYILILYVYDGTRFLSCAMKNRTDKEMVKAYEEPICILTDRGIKSQLQQLENEASRAMKIFLTSQEMDFQLSPPHIHHRNAV